MADPSKHDIPLPTCFTVARIWSIANWAFDRTRWAAYQFISCAAFAELRNFWSIAQGTCNRVRFRVRIRVSFSFRLALGLGLHSWPNAQRVRPKAQRV